MLERLGCWSASVPIHQNREVPSSNSFLPSTVLPSTVHQDPNAQHNVLTPELKREYDQRVIDYLKRVGDFFDYKPGVASFLASEHKGP